MKRILRNIIIAILVVVLLWLIFVTIDCLRLRNSKYYTYPLINLKQDANLERVTYTGLGYTISYVQNKEIIHQPGSDAVASGIGACGAEFKLFGKILIWAYIE
ncbi:MAG: hypothetical protein IJ272_09060 [Clostridia bacterium]|nr:hypothetical protein [Clostridia bacterium]